MQIVARNQPMSTDLDPPTPGEQRQALAANLRERARVVDETNDPVVARTFRNPSVYDLQAQERRQADRIAELAAGVLFGASTRDRLTPRLAADLEQAATYVTRRIHPEFVKAAHDQAVETLLASEDTRGIFAGMSPAQARIRAHWIVAVVRTAFSGTLEGVTPLNLGTYLKCAAAQVEKGARS